MKKFIVPGVLLVLIVALFVFLKADPFEPKLDGNRYLALRSEIDETNIALFAAEDQTEKAAYENHRDSLWGMLVAMRNLSQPNSQQKAAPKAKTQTVVPIQTASNNSASQSSGSNVFIFVIGGLILLIIILGAVFFYLRNRQEAITRQLEKIREENRFKTPKSGFPDDPTYVTRTRVHRSIIDDAKASGPEATVDSTQTGSISSNSTSAPTATPTDDVEFENSKGIVERPTLRPTAKERITKAFQSLSDTLTGLTIPKGIHRDPDKVNNTRAQSHNTMFTEAVPKPNPLEMTRFDKERSDKEKVLQLNRRGLTPSEIARRTQLSEEQVETVIRIKRETGE